MGIADILKGKKKEREMPAKLPWIGDRVIFWLGDASAADQPATPMVMLVTSTVPDAGEVSGMAFIDPDTPFMDAEGNEVEMPPMLPLRRVPYSAGVRKMHWMPMAEFKAVCRAAQEDTE